MRGRSAVRAAGAGAVVAAVAAAGLLVPQSAKAADPQIFGGWFGNWHPPSVVSEHVADGSGVLTDVALFAWNFSGKDNPVCALTLHSGCVPSSAARPYASSNLARALGSISDARRWASHIDLDSWRGGQLAAVMKDPPRRDALTSKLRDFAVSADVDGVDLDWENFAFRDSRRSWKSTKPAFVATVAQLADKLHAQDKLLSVTVPVGDRPFKADGTPNPGSGYTVYAWAEIAGSVDRLNLMAYDYSWDRPGPIGPSSWAESAVRSAVAQVGKANAGKVVIGAPLYGKSWPSRSSTDGLVTTGKCPASWRASSTPSTFTVSPAEAKSLAASHGTKPAFDAESGEYTFTYSETRSGTYQAKVGSKKHPRTVRRSRTCQVQRTVWFAGRKSIIGRGRLASDQGIGGVYIWELPATTAGLMRAYARASASFPSVRLAALSASVAPYQRYRVNATVRNVAKGTKVVLQSAAGSVWRTIATARVGAHRSVVWRLRAPAEAFTSLRAVVESDQGPVRSNAEAFVVSRYFARLAAL